MQPLPHQQALVDSDEPAVVLAGPGISGMTTALLLAAARDIHIPSYRAVLLHSSAHRMSEGLLPPSITLFPKLGGVYLKTHWRWTFSSGATIELDFLDGRANARRRGAAYHFIGFDRVEFFDPADVDRTLKNDCRNAWWRPPEPLWRRALLWFGIVQPTLARVPLRKRATAVTKQAGCEPWITERFLVQIRAHVLEGFDAARMINDEPAESEGDDEAQASGAPPADQLVGVRVPSSSPTDSAS